MPPGGARGVSKSELSLVKATVSVIISLIELFLLPSAARISHSPVALEPRRLLTLLMLLNGLHSTGVSDAKGTPITRQL